MAYGFGMGFNRGFGMFSVYGILFAVMFALIIGVFVFLFVKGISQWNKNNHAPRLTVPATLVAKRTNISHHHRSNTDDFHHHRTSTSYYVTFEVESGDRMEFHISGQEYGLLIEGDKGDLSFQGTRYLGFARR